MTNSSSFVDTFMFIFINDQKMERKQEPTHNPNKILKDETKKTNDDKKYCFRQRKT
jgi:hypothetical protein